jgi:PTS system nitrogen regulatory IIA component
MNLGSLTDPQLIYPDLPGETADGVLHALAVRVAARGLVDDAGKLEARLLEREQLGSTGIGAGVAVPHCKMKGLDRAVVAVGLKRRAVDFAAVDGEPVSLFFLVVSPDDQPAAHLQVLAAISRWVKADEHVERILGLSDQQQIYDFLHGEGS